MGYQRGMLSADMALVLVAWEQSEIQGPDAAWGQLPGVRGLKSWA